MLADKYCQAMLEAATAIQQQAAEIERLRSVAVQYLSLTDAMGYKEGPAGLSPEEYAEALRKDAERLRDDYGNACKLVADMHMAAMGQAIGPVRGVVEDVADLRAEVERLRATLNTIARHYSSDWPQACRANVLAARSALADAARERA
jgi:hypothetical protein